MSKIKMRGFPLHMTLHQFMNRKSLPFISAVILLSPVLQTAGQNTPETVQEKWLERIEIQKTISAEAADWEAEKQQLTNLNAIRLKEIEQLDQLLARSKTLRTENRKLLENKQAEAEEFSERRRQLAQRIDAFEKKLLPLVRKLPAPLSEKLSTEIALLGQPDRPLQDRYRDLTVILTEIGDFNATLTLDTEIRETEDGRSEVDILYLGLARAWYVNRTGTRAGYGIPTSNAWKWTEDPSLAGQVRSAIAIASKQDPPAFTALTLHPEGR
ncbi:DUF3450 family protein [Pontiella agarivorans]|uniref:DUF3450 family protein n=1 Tax=Pontiella agarivorans TaxID=3038953 RepID=A0ABU5MVB9_9BACT|nr:DUF3450 family protein [Pontiella agarivorans]MDZ8118154.1 DUF3450 family protein [Pontiella agarivorans]